MPVVVGHRSTVFLCVKTMNSDIPFFFGILISAYVIVGRAWSIVNVMCLASGCFLLLDNANCLQPGEISWMYDVAPVCPAHSEISLVRNHSTI